MKGIELYYQYKLKILEFPLQSIEHLVEFACSKHYHACMFEPMCQHTTEFTRSKPLTFDARKYISAPKI